MGRKQKQVGERAALARESLVATRMAHNDVCKWVELLARYTPVEPQPSRTPIHLAAMMLYCTWGAVKVKGNDDLIAETMPHWDELPQQVRDAYIGIANELVRIRVDLPAVLQEAATTGKG